MGAGEGFLVGFFIFMIIIITPIILLILAGHNHKKENMVEIIQTLEKRIENALKPEPLTVFTQGMRSFSSIMANGYLSRIDVVDTVNAATRLDDCSDMRNLIHLPAKPDSGNNYSPYDFIVLLITTIRKKNKCQ